MAVRSKDIRYFWPDSQYCLSRSEQIYQCSKCRIAVTYTSSVLSGDNGQLRVGVRRAAKQQAIVRSTYFSSLNLHLGVLAAASHAAKEMFRFSVIYNPRFVDLFLV